MFCRTGVPWDNCKKTVEVEVDLLSKGHTPPVLPLFKIELLPGEISKLGDPSFWILSNAPIPVFTPIALFRFKLVTYARREALRDLLDMDALVQKLTPDGILAFKDDVVRNLGEYEASMVQKIPPAYKELVGVLKKLFDLS
jgi:hypothetical protein